MSTRIFIFFLIIGMALFLSCNTDSDLSKGASKEKALPTQTSVSNSVISKPASDATPSPTSVPTSTPVPSLVQGTCDFDTTPYSRKKPDPARILLWVEKEVEGVLTEIHETVNRHQNVLLTEVWAVDKDGTNLTNLSWIDGIQPTGLNDFSSISVSPDGRKIAYSFYKADDWFLAYIRAGGNEPLWKGKKFIGMVDTYGKSLQKIDLDHDLAVDIVDSSMRGPLTRPQWNESSEEFTYYDQEKPYKILVNDPMLEPIRIKDEFRLKAPNGMYSLNRTKTETFTLENTEDKSIQEINSDGGRFIWSPNSNMLANYNGKTMTVFSADGSCYETIDIEKNSNAPSGPIAWSPDGRYLAWSVRTGGGGIFEDPTYGLVVLNISTKKIYEVAPHIYIENRLSSFNAFFEELSLFQEVSWSDTYSWDPWSSDGKELLVSGEDHIGLVNHDSGKKRWLYKGRYPSWSPDKSEIIFLQGTSLMIGNSDGSEAREILNTDQVSFWNTKLLGVIWVR